MLSKWHTGKRASPQTTRRKKDIKNKRRQRDGDTTLLQKLRTSRTQPKQTSIRLLRLVSPRTASLCKNTSSPRPVKNLLINTPPQTTLLFRATDTGVDEIALQAKLSVGLEHDRMSLRRETDMDRLSPEPVLLPAHMPMIDLRRFVRRIGLEFPIVPGRVILGLAPPEAQAGNVPRRKPRSSRRLPLGSGIGTAPHREQIHHSPPKTETAKTIMGFQKCGVLEAPQEHPH